MLGMDHPRWCRGVAGGNPGNPENPESRDTYINMPISTHSSETNLLHSSAYRSAPIQTPTGYEPSVTLCIPLLCIVASVRLTYLRSSIA